MIKIKGGYMKYIDTYFRDGKELSFEELKTIFKEDLNEEKKSFTWDISGSVYTDFYNGKDIELNGHVYATRTKILYDSAKELFNNLVTNGQSEIILEALNELTETELFGILSKIKCVNVKDNKLLLEDEKDW